MNRIKIYLGSFTRTTRTVLLGLAVIFVSAGIAQAASTTIGTTIVTSGAITTTDALNVTGLATLLGGATTTQITLLSGDTIKNLTASTTIISGALTTTGALTTGGNATIANAAATSTVTVGCIITTATSSATKIRLLFNTSATTSTINNTTVQGSVAWGYGSTCPN